MKQIINFFGNITVVVLITFSATGCSRGLSGTYESECGYYSIKFTSSTKCTWYQDDGFFNGIYKKKDGRYQLEIKGGGLHSNTVFYATKKGKDLIITGGVINGKRFVKERREKGGYLTF